MEKSTQIVLRSILSGPIVITVAKFMAWQLDLELDLPFKVTLLALAGVVMVFALILQFTSLGFED